ncbi:MULTISPECIES: hypothetical protein [Ruegeria]|uniref:hypothetical protein n=1 Tax=Ruegeria TaxID=97050 RepID=UPI00147E1379|nr:MULTISPECIES: hypothetical protein [Ruegeria]NOD65439.1 hypothetical protein [Ruegeria sp. HKCCD6109]NOD69618.1 hypothetical protein [Ruegeria sp. HKCCD7303]
MKIDSRAEIPARQAWRRGQKKKSHFLSTRKAKGVIQTESGLEASFAFGCDLHPKVKAIRPQPCTFDLKSGRVYPTKAELITKFKGTGYKPKPYTPDFEVICFDGRKLFVEVRHSRLLKHNESTLLLPNIFRSLGLELLILTDQFLARDLVHNIRSLHPYIQRSPTDEFLRKLSSIEAQTFRLEFLLQELGCSQIDVLSSIVLGHISVDLRAGMLRPKSVGQLAYGQKSHLEIFPL